MAAIPKKLGTRFLLDPDQAKAANEALANLERLIQAGQFEAAHAVGTALIAPGPWRLSPRSPAQYWLGMAMSWLCARLQRDCPAVDQHPARPASQAAAWVAQQGGLAAVVPVNPWPIRPDKARDRAGLEALLATVQPERYGGEFNLFREHAIEELRCRVHARIAKDLPGDPQPPSPKFASLTHAELADTIERGIGIAFPRDFGASAGLSPMFAAVLDLLDGKPDLATARLARFLPVVKPPESVANFRFWPPYADLLASRALGPAFGIADAGAAAYVEALAGRTPFTITAAAPRPWKVVLKAYAARLADDGVDADRLTATLSYAMPEPKALMARARKGHALNAGAGEEKLAALEARLGMPLPPSYREFLAASDGLVVPDFVSLLPAADVDWLRVRESETIEAWNQGAEEASDADYDVYGADQDCIHMRPRHLHDALQVSASGDGDVLLLVPAVRFGDEWEAWFLGAKNPGAFRFRSFRDLLEQQVLAEPGQ